MMTMIPSEVKDLIDVWKAPQMSLAEVIRWDKYLKGEPGIRKQNSLEHSHSIAVLGAITIPRLQLQQSIDFGLLMTAFNIHDVGEGELGRDTLYIDKSDNQDLQEYLAFRKRWQKLYLSSFSYLEKAFLLQFAIKNPPVFPEEAKVIMTGLAKSHRTEALLFEAIERWDYLLFALEQYLERNNEVIIVQTMRHQKPHLDRLAHEIPQFGHHIWTQDLRVWGRELLVKYEGRHVEQKSA